MRPTDISSLPKTALGDYGNTYGNSAALVYAPANLDEAKSLLIAAKEQKFRIRIRGAGHSISGLTVPRPGAAEVVLSTERLNKIEDYSVSAGTITVQPGVRMAHLQDFILANMPAHFLPVYPDAPGPTVGGFFLAGGVNPSSFANSGFWQWVTQVRLLTADGVVHELRPEDPDFWYLPASSGHLGLVVSLTLKLKPRSEAFNRQTLREMRPVSPAAMLAIVQKYTRVRGLERIFAISDAGLLHLRIEGDDKAIPDQQVSQPQYNKEPGYSIKWFNLLVTDADFLKAFNLLTHLRGFLPHGNLGIYFYKINGNNKLPPLLFQKSGDHWLVGIWYRDDDASVAANKQFAEIFERERSRAALGRYYPTELLPPDITYAKLVSADALAQLKQLKQRYDSQCLFTGGIPLGTPCISR